MTSSMWGRRLVHSWARGREEVSWLGEDSCAGREEWRGGEGRKQTAAIYGGEAPEHGCHVSLLQQFIEHVVSATVATLGGHFGVFCLDSDIGHCSKDISHAILYKFD